MKNNWWDNVLSGHKSYEDLNEEQQKRIFEVIEFLENNCLGWVVGSERIKEALIEVLCRLPQKAAEVLLCNSDIIVVDGSTSATWSWRRICPSHDGFAETWLYIIVLRQTLKSMPQKAVVGEVAREFAHAFLEHRLNASEATQQEADEIARQWGFHDEIDLLNKRPVK